MPLAIATKQISDLPILDIKSLTPGAHDFDPKNSFKINQTDIYVAPIPPHLHNNAMKQSFDVYSILSLIVGTAVPLIVAALVRIAALNSSKDAVSAKLARHETVDPTFPIENFFPMATQFPENKINHNQQQVFPMIHLTTPQT
jgi:hypothetical protein